MAREPQRIKKRERKNISSGVAHVNASFNNTMITITDAQGNGTLLVPADAALMHVIAMKDGAGFDYQLFWKKDEHRTDPYRLDPDYKGPFNFTLNAVKKVTVKDLEVFHKARLAPGHLTVAFAGDIDSVSIHLGPVMMPKALDAVTRKTQQGAE